MSRLPDASPARATCTKCSAAFDVIAPVIAITGLTLKNETTSEQTSLDVLDGNFSSTIAGACPRCGGDASVPVVEIADDEGKSAWVTSTDVRVLAQIRRSLGDLPRDAEAAARLIEEKAPALKPLADWLRENAHLS